MVSPHAYWATDFCNLTQDPSSHSHKLFFYRENLIFVNALSCHSLQFTTFSCSVMMAIFLGSSTSPERLVRQTRRKHSKGARDGSSKTKKGWDGLTGKDHQ